ncbi:hypothetical protein V5N11_008632 [Cardamine amara subsp. amara]|uniref:Uncharacterized protein n=1 Tax=Cardamine amara subsp. amara TaxID=228776 RepID=A0ABD1ACT1_CARAN
MIKQYARLGLHRYNMLEGTSFELSVLLKFNMLQNLVSSYYITVLAYDPEANLPPKTFQIRVDEKKYGSLNVVVSVARLKDEAATTKEPFMPHFHGGVVADPFFQGELPDWPSAHAFSDRKRFYVLKKSEWHDTAWISLYLETLVYANDRDISNDILSKLEIINVAIETKEEDVKSPNEILKAKSAHVYITFKGLEESFFQTETFKGSAKALRLSKGIPRKAVVRRVISRGALSLEQHSMTLRSGQKSQSSKLLRLGV